MSSNSLSRTAARTCTPWPPVPPVSPAERRKGVNHSATLLNSRRIYPGPRLHAGYNVQMRVHARSARVALAALALAAPWWACKRNAPLGPDVLATVDGKPIYRAEVERQYKSRQSTDAEPGNAEQALGLKLNI